MTTNKAFKNSFRFKTRAIVLRGKENKGRKKKLYVRPTIEILPDGKVRIIKVVIAEKVSELESIASN